MKKVGIYGNADPSKAKEIREWFNSIGASNLFGFLPLNSECVYHIDFNNDIWYTLKSETTRSEFNFIGTLEEVKAYLKEQDEYTT